MKINPSMLYWPMNIKTREETKKKLKTNSGPAIHISGLSEDCISSMAHSCLSSSITSSGDKVGTVSRSTRALDFTSISLSVACSSSDLASASLFS